MSGRIDSSASTEQRNAVLNIAEGAVFIAGSAFISSQTVLPALVSRLGGSNVAVGAIGVLTWIGLFLPQILSARFVQASPWKKQWTVRFGFLQRVFALLIGFGVLLVGGTSPGLALWALFLLYGAMQLVMGITTPWWFDLFAKLTPVRKRGRVVGIRNSIGAACAFMCGIVLTWLLGATEFPTSYAFAFLCAGSIQMLSLILQQRLIETEPSAVVESKSLASYVRQLREVLRMNKEFRAFVISSAVLILATMPTGFFTVYALKHFHAPESIVGEFTLTIVATQVVSSFVNGFVADRFGNKIAVILASTSMLLASIWALLAPTLSSFVIVFMFLGAHLGSELLARYNMSIEYGPPEQRSTYVGLMNTILAPIYLCGLLGGWISDQFGYQTVFMIGAIFSAIGLALFIFWVKDPRTAMVEAKQQ
ncbi:MAG: MFS transporter [Bacteroidota bacterium]